jgi:hypothetical protein
VLFVASNDLTPLIQLLRNTRNGWCSWMLQLWWLCVVFRVVLVLSILSWYGSQFRCTRVGFHHFLDRIVLPSQLRLPCIFSLLSLIIVTGSLTCLLFSVIFRTSPPTLQTIAINCHFFHHRLETRFSSSNLQCSRTSSCKLS